MHSSDGDVEYHSPSASEIASGLGVPDLVELASSPPDSQREYSLDSVDDVATCAEIRYIDRVTFDLIESVRNWVVGGELVDSLYPTVELRLDEHMMYYLGNALGVPDVVETFGTVAATGRTVQVTVDGHPIDADVYEAEGLESLAFRYGEAIITIVVPEGESVTEFRTAGHRND